MESQMTRPYGQDQAEDPIRIHHPEEEEHQEKGASKVMKKVKEKAKKIKNSLTKHGNGHEHDHDVEEEDDEYDEQNPEVHGAPVYESSAVRGGVTGQPESQSHTGETKVPAPEEIIPPGTKFFPVVSSDQTKPVEPEPLQEASYRHEAPSHPVRMSDREERREATAHNTPASLLSSTEDVTRTFAPGEDEYLGGQRRVNVERPKGLEKDPSSPGGGSDYLSGVPNYQSKVTDPTHKGGEAGVPEIADSLGRMKVTDEKPGRGFERDLPTRSHENESKCGEGFPAGFGGESGAGVGKDFPTRSDDVKAETGLGKNLPTGTHDQFSPELSRPKERNDFDSKDESKPSTYTEKIGSATSFVTGKAIAAKNAVASKLGYSGETTGGGGQHESPLGGDEKMRSSGQHETPVGEETPRSATGYGQKMAGTVAEKLTPVYEKVKETGSAVMTKLPLSGGGSGAEEKQQVGDKGVAGKGYLAEKFSPGEDDKALSEVIAEKLHLGGGEKKTTTTKEVEVTVEKIPSDKISEERVHGDVTAEEGKGGGGMVGKVKGAVTSWLGGSTEKEVKPKSVDSGEESSQSLGSTVGKNKI
ncbi:hypothetical protein EUTSA_v10013021mg [Eutrema salsugineum]|uniref:Low-temperature-induced 65 kDa protein n=1 Tax=Eutrema salsugineum TaxID=72664 RepID=V4NBJ8_EUTSA|nr:hypothetical protein EUTSA_v10013021mg [Eutrema salsugineum]